MALKVIGGLLVLFGLTDMIGSFAGLDVWRQWLHIDLPELIWSFSAYIEMALGYFLFNLGSADSDSEEYE